MEPATIEILSRGGRLWHQGQPVHIKGINWFGFETPNACVHGLWAKPLAFFLQTLVDPLSINALRVPFSCELALNPCTKPSGIDFSLNPELEGRTSIECLDTLVQEAAERGILIMLDMHHLSAHGGKR